MMKNTHILKYNGVKVNCFDFTSRIPHPTTINAFFAKKVLMDVIRSLKDVKVEKDFIDIIFNTNFVEAGTTASISIKGVRGDLSVASQMIINALPKNRESVFGCVFNASTRVISVFYILHESNIYDYNFNIGYNLESILLENWPSIYEYREEDFKPSKLISSYNGPIENDIQTQKKYLKRMNNMMDSIIQEKKAYSGTMECFVNSLYEMLGFPHSDEEAINELQSLKDMRVFDTYKVFDKSVIEIPEDYRLFIDTTQFL